MSLPHAKERPRGSCLSSYDVPEVIPGIRAVLEHHPNRLASLQIVAVAAGVETLSHRTLSDLAHAVAIERLHTVGTAPHAVDHVLRDWHVVHLAPEPRRPFPKSIVIIDRGDACVALLAVQPAVANQFSHG